MSRIFVTGGSGFIGTNLVQECAAAGHEVLNVDIQRPRMSDKSGRFIQQDICDRDGLVAAVRSFNPEYIFHLAARTDLFGRSVDEYRTNTVGVSNVVAAAKSAPRLKRAVFASSMYVCRVGYIPRDESDICPHTAYGESKVAGERIVREEARDIFCWSIVRPTSIWGPWFGVPYRDFFDAVQKRLYVHPQGVRIQRSYGFVLNTVYQLMQLGMGGADADRHRRTLYIADYEPVDTREWGDLIAESFGTPQIREAPLLAMRAVARAGDLLKLFGMRNPPLTTPRLNNMLTNAVLDLTPIQRLAGPTPYTLMEGIELTVAWMRRPPAAGVAEPSPDAAYVPSEYDWM